MLCGGVVENMNKTRSLGLIAVSAFCTLGWLACSASDDTNGNGNNGGGTGTGTGTGSSSGTGGDLGLGGNTGQGGGIQGCDPQTFTLQQAPPAEVYLVIDRSGSMNDPGATPGMTKWEELNAAADLALTQYEATVHFGLLMYPTGDECNTSGPQVAVDVNNKQAIANQLTATVPAGGTPTAAALNNAAASLTALGSTESPKFIVLATDGGPNCNYFLAADPACSCNYAQPGYCCTNYPASCYFGSSCLDDQGTLDVITDLYDNLGIPTFVIGLAGTAEYESLLDAMAVAGGVPQQGGTTDYYAVTDEASLLQALQTIAVSVISCQIELEQAPEVPDGVTIYIDGQAVDRDPTKTDGWDYTDPSYTTIELYGAACETLQDGEEHQVTATFECEIR
jgi:hypothetical protein